MRLINSPGVQFVAIFIQLFSASRVLSQSEGGGEVLLQTSSKKGSRRDVRPPSPPPIELHMMYIHYIEYINIT